MALVDVLEPKTMGYCESCDKWDDAKDFREVEVFYVGDGLYDLARENEYIYKEDHPNLFYGEIEHKSCEQLQSDLTKNDKTMFRCTECGEIYDTFSEGRECC